MAGKRAPSNKVTIYNVSKKLVTKVSGSYSDRQVRFKCQDSYDGYAGVRVPYSCFSESANPNFFHVQMPKDMELSMRVKTGIRLGDVEERRITPREFKDMFEATRYPKKKKEETTSIALAEGQQNQARNYAPPQLDDDDFPY